jgi:hypothetical protein
MRRRRLALVSLLCGLAVVVAAQRLAPIAGPPLYDGVVAEDQYHWLSPPSGFAGGAQSASASGAVQGGQSPNLSVGTPEQPPQAQVFAGQGYLVLPPGTTSINVSIEPVQPAAQPTDGVIAGNVYHFSLTSQTGGAISGQTSGGVTVVLRGPPNLPSATIERLAAGSWAPLQTDPAGAPHMFTAVVTDFGDFALVAPPGWVPAQTGPGAPAQVGPAVPGATAPPTPSSSAGGPAESGTPVLLMAGAGLAIAIIIAAGVLLLLRRRPAGAVQSRRPSRPEPSAGGRRRRPPPRRR